MFKRIVASALLAGAAAGAVAAILQLLFVQPVLLNAELYEGGDLVHFGTGTASASNPELGAIDIRRNGLTALYTILLYAGYALVLVALMALAERRGARIDGRAGLAWGLCGFAAVFVAPGFSDPPVVPGAATADLAARQIWWFATVIAASVALWLVAFGKGFATRAAAVVLLLAPHAVGAPAPEEFAGLAPPEIGALFASRVYGAGLASWAVLGAIAGHLWHRDRERSAA